MKNNPYQAYKKQSIMTMTSCDMLTTLYDGLLKELTQAKQSFLARDFAKVNHHLQKVQSILHYLQGTLDFQYEISNSLNSLYDYFLHVAIDANVKKDPAGLDDIMEMIGELRDTYIQADKKNRAAEVVG